jgi:hypothetical protein
MSQESTIRRGVRNARYATIPNHVFEDARLSMEARWLLCYLLSKPDNWTVAIGDIIKKGNCGRDKARRMIAELVEQGYAERDEQNRNNGKFGASALVIFDEPRTPIERAEGESVASLPQTDLPSTAEPSTVLPSPVKSAHSNNLNLAIPENSNLREGARESEEGQGEDPKKVEAAFWRTIKDWPGFDGMPKEKAFAEWFRLSSDERHRAEKRRDAWFTLLKAQKKSHFPAPSTYFREKLFDEVPDKLAEPEGPRFVKAAPFGKLMMATRLADLLRKPYGAIGALTVTEQRSIERIEATRRGEVLDFALMRSEQRILDSGEGAAAAIWREKRMRSGWPIAVEMAEQARSRQPSVCPIELQDAAASFHQVHCDSLQMNAWRAEHERRGWPFFDGKLPDWIYFPAIGEGHDDYHAAVRAALDAFAEQISDFLKERSKGDDDAA